MILRHRRFLSSVLARFRSFLHREPFAALTPGSQERTSGEGAVCTCDFSADELCDQALSHMLECRFCLDPIASSCPVYDQFQIEIGTRGSALNAAVYAI
ncbi:MAG: hypothetical protein ACJ746_11435 [Bryobacteraceae bacterium]